MSEVDVSDWGGFVSVLLEEFFVPFFVMGKDHFPRIKNSFL